MMERLATPDATGPPEPRLPRRRRRPALRHRGLQRLDGHARVRRRRRRWHRRHARPPGPASSRRALALPDAGRRTCSCSTPGCHVRRAAGTRALGHCIVHEPVADTGRRPLRRRGRARRRRPRATRPPGRPRHVHQRRHPPAVPRRPGPPRGVLSSYGDGDDASVDGAIERALRQLGDDIDIVVMSFGRYGDTDRPPPMAAAIAGCCGAASSSPRPATTATCRPYYPAALPGVVGVGAVDAGGRSAFSNFGPWVDACAPGVDVVSTFFTEFDDADPTAAASTSTGAGRRGAGRASAARRSPPPSPRSSTSTAARPGRMGAPGPRSAFRHPDLGVVVNV